MKEKEKILEERRALQHEFERIQTKIDRLPDSKLHLLRGLCKEQQDVFNKIRALEFKLAKLWQ